MVRDLKEEYLRYKREALRRYYSGMNDMQRRAVFHIDGPLLILAGAGSGKTTVLINRVENMIRFGNAYESEELPKGADEAELEAGINALRGYAQETAINPEELGRVVAENTVRPWNILAITFTNKAAGELKSRLAEKLGPEGADVHASTFHSLCARILRRDIEALAGYKNGFTIYDTDDSLRVVKEASRELGIDEKLLAPKAVLGAISRAKDRLGTPEQMLRESAGDFRSECVARVYALYQKRLVAANALDFDDIIVNTVRLFQGFPEVLEYYRNRYRYVMVDEYQDTNHAQYLLISLLAGGHGNLCVVGDDDQSIYKFRGATIENIMSFESQFKSAAVIRLEQNYRSTGNILNAANGIIANNRARKGKNLWTNSDEGEKVLMARVRDEIEESRLIADSIQENVRGGAKFSDHAILYRMNAQANSLERALAKNAVPYRVIGGTRFFDHKEIRDVVAYLSVLNNPEDTVRLTRIINEPRRGIGDATLTSAREIADTLGISLFEAVESADEYAALARKAAPLKEFAKLIRGLMEISETKPLDYLFDELLTRTGYIKSLEALGFEGIGRIENVLEFKSIIVKYIQESKEPSLSGFLEEIALYTDLDNYDAEADSVTLMTIHSAKGLEFRYVYIAGMDEGIFPGWMAASTEAELEEERRLAYVAVTRAKERLSLISAESRLIFGQTMYNRPSRFVGEIPPELLDVKTAVREKRVHTHPAPKPERPASSRDWGVGGGPAKRSEGGVFKVGERVEHKVFGVGTVLTAKPMAADTLLEISFDKAGVKKVMANFARLSRAD